MGQVIPFQSAPRGRTPAAPPSGQDGEAKILFFLGVRYCRHHDNGGDQETGGGQDTGGGQETGGGERGTRKRGAARGRRAKPA